MGIINMCSGVFQQGGASPLASAHFAVGEVLDEVKTRSGNGWEKWGVLRSVFGTAGRFSWDLFGVSSAFFGAFPGKPEQFPNKTRIKPEQNSKEFRIMPEKHSNTLM